jgi:cardiolipin synthase
MEKINALIVIILNLFVLNFAFSEMVVPESLITYPIDEQGNYARDVLVQEIKAAKTSIQISIYQIKDAAIINALCERAEAGVQVDIIYEENPYQHAFNKAVKDQGDLLTQIINSPIRLHQRPENLKTAFPKGHYHARYIIIDKNRFLLTTGNFDETTFDHCRDFCVVFMKEKHEAIFKALLDLFDRDITNQPISDLPESKALIIGPHNQREKIVSYLEGAQRSVKMYQQFFNDPVIRDCVIKLIKEKGIKVEVVMMAYPTNYKSDPNAETQDALARAGADVRLMDHLYGHARAVIVDDTFALIGTTQLSPPSLDENREISIIIEGAVVSKLVEQFKKDQLLSYSVEEGRARALTKKMDWSQVILTRK